MALSDPLERLQKLADLRDHGVLPDAEFAAEKAKIFGNGSDDAPGKAESALASLEHCRRSSGYAFRPPGSLLWTLNRS